MLKKILKHRLSINTGQGALIQLAGYLIPLLVMLHLTKILGLVIYGVVAFSVAITQTAVNFLDMGFTHSVVSNISFWGKRKLLLGKLIGAVYTLKLFFFVLVAIPVIAYSILTKKYEGYTLLFVLSLFPVGIQCFLPTWFFIGLERMGKVTFLVLVSKLFFVLLIIYFIKEPADYIWVPIADGISQLASALLANITLNRLGYKVVTPSLRLITHTYKVTGGFFAARIAGYLYMTGGALVLGLVTSPGLVALYTIAEQGFRLITSLFNPLIQALIPYMINEKNLRLLIKISLIAIIFLVFVVVISYYLAPPMISLFLGDQWNGVIPIFNIFLIAAIVDLLTVLVGYPLGAVIHNLKMANRTIIYGGIAYVAMNSYALFFNFITPQNVVCILIFSQLIVLGLRIHIFLNYARQKKSSV